MSLSIPLPEGWVVDGDGVPTTNPNLYPKVGAMMPMAGHKGYGLAIMVETFSAILSGAGVMGQVMSWGLHDPSQPTGHGHSFIAVNVGAMMPVGEFKTRMDQAIRTLRNAPKAKGSERIYIPGEMEWEKQKQAQVEGIPLPEDVRANLRGLAADVGLAVPEWLQ